MHTRQGAVQITERREKEEVLRRFAALASSLFGTNNLSVAIFAPIIKYDGESGRYVTGVPSPRCPRRPDL